MLKMNKQQGMNIAEIKLYEFFLRALNLWTTCQLLYGIILLRG